MSSYSDGSQTATVTTEHTLATITTAGTYVLTVDCNNMALADELTLKVKLKVRSTGTTRLLQQAKYMHAQAEPVKMSLPVHCTNELVFTLTQDAGTGRAFPWEILQLDG